MSQKILAAIAGGLILLVLGLAFFWQPARPPGTPLASEATAGGDFTLQSADGPVSLKDFRGRVVVLNFGYTYCPDICPTTLAATAAGLKALDPQEAGRVAALFVSVDPERDTPAHLKEYASFFHPALVGLTGAPEAVAAVARQYGVFYARQAADSSGRYSVDHTAETYVIAPDGRLAARLPHSAGPERLAAEIRQQLAQR